MSEWVGWLGTGSEELGVNFKKRKSATRKKYGVKTSTNDLKVKQMNKKNKHSFSAITVLKTNVIKKEEEKATVLFRTARCVLLADQANLAHKRNAEFRVWIAIDRHSRKATTAKP